MKKHIKLIFLLLVIVATLLIYKITYHEGYNYVALGDSLAAGMNPYGEENYGYSDYVKDYLEQKDLLKFYTNDFATSGYTIDDLQEDIENNKRIDIDGDKVSIRKILRESDIVTISIGANDFLKLFNTKKLDYKDLKKISNNKGLYLKKIDSIALELDQLLIEVKKYAKGDIILLGYYNPLPYIETYKKEIDYLIEYGNNKFLEVCEDNDILFIDIFNNLDSKKIYFPNPADIHPNNYGYKVIAKQVIETIERNIINEK